MSDSIHMTVKQAVKESGYDYGSTEFKRYVFEYNIELLAEKRAIKNASRRQRQVKKLQAENGIDWKGKH